MAGVSRWPGISSPGPARDFTRSPAALILPGRAVASVLGDRIGGCGRGFNAVRIAEETAEARESNGRRLPVQ